MLYVVASGAIGYSEIFGIATSEAEAEKIKQKAIEDGYGPAKFIIIEPHKPDTYYSPEDNKP